MCPCFLSKEIVHFLLPKGDMLEQLREYLKSGLGGMGECHSVQLPSSFPLIISNGYVFQRTEVMGRACIVALSVEGISYTPRRVQKQLARVEDACGLPVVFVTRTLHPHDKERYLAIGQSLVVPGRFAYLPFVGTRQDDSRRSFVLTRDTFSPIAQMIVLAFLEHKLKLPVLIKDVQELLHVTPPAVQNAFREIEGLGLAERRRIPASRALELVFAVEGYELWEQAQPFLVSPVKRIVGLSAMPPRGGDCVIAGVDALSEISRLNTQSPTEFALPLEGFVKRNLEVVSTRDAPFRGQLWSYSPVRLGGTTIDVLSLILSLRGVVDDRVQIEIARILETFGW